MAFEIMQQANYIGGAALVVILLLWFNRKVRGLTAVGAAVVVAGIAYYNNLTKEQVAQAAAQAKKGTN